ncbi:hypothetical protein H072_11551 [Dactylellina haptotyla CBS 200.50]|uniref:Uncharacterized protein n=1 Tax=Dactylellina haptotyla (strain CBS 200.50) TaxID=1284197 RepID=S8B803_DACHA|nr:hypothetical protein H072_11551 [Dactylellina haptotyla CBS 200.50]
MQISKIVSVLAVFAATTFAIPMDPNYQPEIAARAVPVFGSGINGMPMPATGTALKAEVIKMRPPNLPSSIRNGMSGLPQSTWNQALALEKQALAKTQSGSTDKTLGYQLINMWSLMMKGQSPDFKNLSSKPPAIPM